MTTRICVLITSHNRKDITLTCLAALFASNAQNVTWQTVLVDDGSTDGTSEAVGRKFPQVEIVQGDGNLYWNRGMHRAWEHALDYETDFYLWLNDDTELYPGAITNLLNAAAEFGPKSIVAGRIEDERGKIVYGGMSYVSTPINLPLGRKLNYNAIEIVTDDRIYCETMNGNCVLIPKAAATDVGINDPLYWHAWGDVDYGFRATKAGYGIVQVREPVAKGTYNRSYQDKLSVLTTKNWQYIFFHPKGRRLSESTQFYRNYLRPFWFLRMAWSYIRMIRLG